MSQVKIWDDDETISLSDNDIHDGDLKVSTELGPRTLLFRENGAWVEFFPRLDDDDKVKESNLPVSIIPVFDTETAFISSDQTYDQTSLTNVTVLHVPVVSFKVCHFIARIVYASEGNAGALFTVDGPTFNSLAYRSAFGLTAGNVENVAFGNDWNLPASAADHSQFTDYNIAIIEGMLYPSASGTLQVKFASETAGQDIIVKVGSYLFTENFFPGF